MYVCALVKKGGMPPGPRAGFSMCVHKKWVVLFGGVVDIEAEGQHFLYCFRLFWYNYFFCLLISPNECAGDVLMSLFLNELYSFH